MSTFRQAPRTGFWSIERVVAVLTPLFSAAAGYVATLLGKLIPGVNLNKTDLTALFISVAIIAGGAALKWLHGRQKFVNFVTDAEHVAESVVHKITSDQLAGPVLAEVERLLRAHEDSIIAAIGKTIGASASAEDIAKQIVQNLWPQGPPAPAGTAAPSQAAS